MEKVFLVVSHDKSTGNVVCHGACATMNIAIILFRNVCKKVFHCDDEELDKLTKKKFVVYCSAFRDIYITEAVSFVTTEKEAETAE